MSTCPCVSICLCIHTVSACLCIHQRARRLQESWYTALLGMKRSTSFGGLQFGKSHP